MKEFGVLVQEDVGDIQSEIRKIGLKAWQNIRSYFTPVKNHVESVDRKSIESSGKHQQQKQQQQKIFSNEYDQPVRITIPDLPPRPTVLFPTYESVPDEKQTTSISVPKLTHIKMDSLSSPPISINTKFSYSMYEKAKQELNKERGVYPYNTQYTPPQEIMIPSSLQDSTTTIPVITTMLAPSNQDPLDLDHPMEVDEKSKNLKRKLVKAKYNEYQKILRLQDEEELNRVESKKSNKRRIHWENVSSPMTILNPHQSLDIAPFQLLEPTPKQLKQQLGKETNKRKVESLYFSLPSKDVGFVQKDPEYLRSLKLLEGVNGLDPRRVVDLRVGNSLYQAGGQELVDWADINLNYKKLKSMENFWGKK